MAKHFNLQITGNELSVVKILLLIFLVVRLLLIFTGDTKTLDKGDGTYYNGYAIGVILDNEEWMQNHPNEIDDKRAPVYPLFLSFTYLLFGIEKFWAVFVLQAFISLILCYYVYLFAARLFDKKIALLALGWSGLYLIQIRYINQISREVLIFTLLFIVFYYLYLFLSQKENKYLFLTSLFYALLIHLDPRYLFYAPFLFFAFLVYEPLYISIKKYILFGLLTLFISTPWLIRNYYYYDGIVVISTKYLDLRKKANTFSSSQNFRENYTEADFMKQSMGSGNINFTIKDSTKIISERERKLIKQGLNLNSRSLGEVEAVLNDIYPPSTFWAKRWFMFKQLWRPTKFRGDFFPYPGGSYNVWSLKHNLINLIFYGVLLPFMLVGIVTLFRKRRKELIFFAIPIIAQTIIHTFIWSRERYRHPIDTFIIILAVYGFVTILNFIQEKRKSNEKRSLHTNTYL